MDEIVHEIVEIVRQRVAKYSEVLDELWGLLEHDQIELLDVETRTFLQANHEKLWHSEEVLGTTGYGETVANGSET